MAAAAAAHDDDPYGDILTAILDGYGSLSPGSLPPGSAVAMSPQWPDLFFSPVDAAFHLSAVGDRRPSGEDGDESDEQGRKDSKISVLVSLEVRDGDNLDHLRHDSSSNANSSSTNNNSNTPYQAGWNEQQRQGQQALPAVAPAGPTKNLSEQATAFPPATSHSAAAAASFSNRADDRVPSQPAAKAFPIYRNGLSLSGKTVRPAELKLSYSNGSTGATRQRSAHSPSPKPDRPLPALPTDEPAANETDPPPPSSSSSSWKARTPTSSFDTGSLLSPFPVARKPLAAGPSASTSLSRRPSVASSKASVASASASSFSLSSSFSSSPRPPFARHLPESVTPPLTSAPRWNNNFTLQRKPSSNSYASSTTSTTLSHPVNREKPLPPIFRFPESPPAPPPVHTEPSAMGNKHSRSANADAAHPGAGPGARASPLHSKGFAASISGDACLPPFFGAASKSHTASASASAAVPVPSSSSSTGSVPRRPTHSQSTFGTTDTQPSSVGQYRSEEDLMRSPSQKSSTQNLPQLFLPPPSPLLGESPSKYGLGLGLFDGSKPAGPKEDARVEDAPYSPRTHSRGKSSNGLDMFRAAAALSAANKFKSSLPSNPKAGVPACFKGQARANKTLAAAPAVPAAPTELLLPSTTYKPMTGLSSSTATVSASTTNSTGATISGTVGSEEETGRKHDSPMMMMMSSSASASTSTSSSWAGAQRANKVSQQHHSPLQPPSHAPYHHHAAAHSRAPSVSSPAPAPAPAPVLLPSSVFTYHQHSASNPAPTKAEPVRQPHAYPNLHTLFHRSEGSTILPDSSSSGGAGGMAAGSTAAPVLSTQLRCYHAHARFHVSRTTLAPSPCMVCALSDFTDRWTCAWCALRICTACRAGLERIPGRKLGVLLGVESAPQVRPGDAVAGAPAGGARGNPTRGSHGGMLLGY